MITRKVRWLDVALSAVILAGCSLGALAQPQSATILQITDFHAVGDGQTDDTAALQKAIDSAVARHATLEFPPGPGGGCYASGSLTIKNADHVTLRGSGGVICWKGGKEGAPRIGLGYAGNLTDVTIEGLEITGAGPEKMYHAGIAAPSGSNLKNIIIRKNYVHDVSLGISLNADSGGTIDNFLIAENKVEHVVGTASGYGYGIHHANGSGTPSNGRIVGNTLIGCERNSIYEAKGSGVIIANNTILNHGGNRPRQSSPLTGIQVGRGSDILVIGNIIDGASDGSMDIGTDHQIPTHDIEVISNKFINPRGVLAMIHIGSEGPATEGVIERIKVIGNTVVVDGTRILPVQINSGKHIDIIGNSIQVLHAPGSFSTAVQVRGEGESSGSAHYTDQLYIAYNEVKLSTPGAADAAFATTPSAASSAINARFAGNRVDTPSGSFRVEGALNRRAALPDGQTPENHIRKTVSLDGSAPRPVPGCFPKPVPFPGVSPGDTVRISSSSPLPLNYILESIVSAPGEVTVKWCQLFGPPTDPPGGSYIIDVWKR